MKELAVLACVMQCTLAFSMSVRDYGAVGDGKGLTPADSNIDISNESWNAWPIKISSDVSSVVFTASKPFANTDTWDYIGIQRSIFEHAGRTYIPAGAYVVNKPVLVVKGLEQQIVGDGMYSTKLHYKELKSYPSVAMETGKSYKPLLRLYRVGGPPTVVRDICFIGPDNYQKDSHHLALISQENTNGVHLENLWLTSCDIGVFYNWSSGDSYVSNVTAEYCFDAIVYQHDNCDLDVSFCNFWSSQNVYASNAVRSKGSRVSITHTKFVGFLGGAVISQNSALISSCSFDPSPGCSGIINAGPKSTIIGNTISCAAAVDRLVILRSQSSFSGNVVSNGSNHAEVSVEFDATHCQSSVVSGNVFVHSNASDEPQNFSIIAHCPGVSYSEGAQKCVVSGNSFSGSSRAAVSINLSTNVVAGNSY